MNVGEQVCVSVGARPRWVHTGVELTRGESYGLSASGLWRDWKIESGPDGYASRGPLMRLVERWRRLPHAPWFALIGGIADVEDSLFAIGSSVDYSPPRSGELRCFANDVSWAYFNNHGSITLTVTRTR